MIASQMAKILKSRGIEVFLKKKTTKIDVVDGKAYFQLEDGSEFVAEKALISIGRKFNSDINGLDDLGINKTPNGAIIVDKYQKTNIDNIYAIGDVVGGMLLAHVASYEGEKALANILNEEYPDSVIPSAIFSIPEIGTVGETAQNTTRKLKKGMFSYQASGKAMAIGEEKGLAIFYADEEDYLVGSTIMGADSSNLIQLITLAINNQMTIDKFVKNVFPHPTLSEIVLEGVEDIHGMAIHKYGMK
jgi:dihydrolipoamide dehydrogenase